MEDDWLIKSLLLVHHFCCFLLKHPSFDCSCSVKASRHSFWLLFWFLVQSSLCFAISESSEARIRFLKTTSSLSQATFLNFNRYQLSSQDSNIVSRLLLLIVVHCLLTSWPTSWASWCGDLVRQFRQNSYLRKHSALSPDNPFCLLYWKTASLQK